jgi:hypothetical protein
MQGITGTAPRDGDALEWAAVECSRYLGADLFPARQDDLLAALVQQRAPSRLLHHLATLDPRTVYTSLADVLADCGTHGAPSTQPSSPDLCP